MELHGVICLRRGVLIRQTYQRMLFQRRRQLLPECNGLKIEEDSSTRGHIHQKEMILFILNLTAHLTLE